MSESKVIVVASGGLDSTVLAYYLKHRGHELALVSFRYGQRHARELFSARKVAEALGVAFRVLDLHALGDISHSSLTDARVPVPDGHYTDERMAITVVPFRNPIFLSFAFALAVNARADAVAIGVHAGDHAIYPDCRVEFIDAFADMQKVALDGIAHVELMAPFARLRKEEIVLLGAELRVPFDLTWSCYKGGSVHCGTCATCTERREAFMLANVPDPTEYAPK